MFEERIALVKESMAMGRLRALNIQFKKLCYSSFSLLVPLHLSNISAAIKWIQKLPAKVALKNAWQKLMTALKKMTEGGKHK